MEPWQNVIATVEFDTLRPRHSCQFVRAMVLHSRIRQTRTRTASGGKGGSIVNVSSTSAASSHPLAYGISKAAQGAIGKTLHPNHGIAYVSIPLCQV
mmetsp:Transcript_13762/g.24905  ORF Transcript_13762/g.24905 Transcript_13762/m.24905 type:complete len:97 (-) Transcript_13762:38-328(-)